VSASPHDRRRLVVTLRHRRGLSFERIGRALDVSRQRAWQLYREGTWPTDVAIAERRKRNLLRAVDRALRG
jgi:hypothetical protein